MVPASNFSANVCETCLRAPHAAREKRGRFVERHLWALEGRWVVELRLRDKATERKVGSEVPAHHAPPMTVHTASNHLRSS